jgi:hypothetical protein
VAPLADVDEREHCTAGRVSLAIRRCNCAAAGELNLTPRDDPSAAAQDFT